MKRHITIGKIPSMMIAAIASVWAIQGFKSIEPDVFPVVANFTVENLERENGSLFISGYMDKVRDCRFMDLAVYDVAVNPMRILDIEFLDTPNTVQNRQTGLQAWGVWKITPGTKNIQLIARHECNTGIVKTVLYHGAI